MQVLIQVSLVEVHHHTVCITLLRLPTTALSIKNKM